MRVALISAYQTEMFTNLGLLCLASYARSKISDLNIRIFSDYDELALDEIASFNPDIVGISAMTPSYERACQMAESIRIRLERTIIAVGGAHITLAPESFRKCFDVGVIGEGEETMCEIILGFANNKSSIHGITYWDHGIRKETPKRDPLDLNQYPDLDYSLLSKNIFNRMPMGALGIWGIEGMMETSRGCPFRCIFCATARVWDSVRFFPIDWVIRNAKALISCGCTCLQLTDDLFTVNRKRLKAIASEFISNGISKACKLCVQGRTNLFDDDTCRTLKDCGCYSVFFGFESGTDRVLKMLKGDQSSVIGNWNAIDTCNRNNMEFWGAVIIAAPTETVEEMLATIDFVDAARRRGARRIGIGMATPYPGTPLWDIAEQKGIVSTNMDFSGFGNMLHGYPALLDQSQRDRFGVVLKKARMAGHKFKYGKAMSLFKSDPIATIKLAASNLQHVKRLIMPSIP